MKNKFIINILFTNMSKFTFIFILILIFIGTNGCVHKTTVPLEVFDSLTPSTQPFQSINKIAQKQNKFTNIEKSVVYIQNQVKGKLIFHIGSGIVINHDLKNELLYVLTTKHLFDLAKGPDENNVFIRPNSSVADEIGDKPLLIFLPAKILKFSSDRTDLALLECNYKDISESLKEYVKKITTSSLVEDSLPAQGDEVIAMGFPRGDGVVYTKGIVSRLVAYEPGLIYIISDAEVLGGNSGGPLLNEDGNVIGIIQMTQVNNDFSISLSTIEIVQWLRNNDFHYFNDFNDFEIIEIKNAQKGR